LNLPKPYTYPLINASKKRGVFSYTKCDSTQNKKTHKSNRKFSIADTTYTDVYVTDNSKSSLLGIPLFWEHERVVLDFLSKKMYLVTPTKQLKKFSISNISASQRISARIGMIKHEGYFENTYKNQIKITSQETKDTLAYKFNGPVKYYVNIDKKDRFILDSIVGKGTLLGHKNTSINDALEKPIHITMENHNLLDLKKHLSD
jgi:hypothetical protein